MPNNDTPEPEDTYSEAETVARREASVRNMLTAPPKPHEAINGRRRVESQSK